MKSLEGFINEMLEIVNDLNKIADEEQCESKNNENENISHPKHYNRDGAIECIDEMVAVFGIYDVMNFCKLNAWKYRYRASEKNGNEDLKKSDWYMKKYIELKEKESEELPF